MFLARHDTLCAFANRRILSVGTAVVTDGLRYTVRFTCVCTVTCETMTQELEPRIVLPVGDIHIDITHTQQLCLFFFARSLPS